MTRYYPNTDYSGHNRKPKRRPWILALKIFCWVVGILVVAAGIAVWIISAYVSPEHIAKIIEKESDKYLNAEVKIGNLDYHFVKSYPWIEFEVDSLQVISRSLNGLTASQRALLPSNADSLARVIKIQGKINVHDLIHKKIRIKDIVVDKPYVNIVVYNDSINNFNITRRHLPKVKKMPEIDISEVNVEEPLVLNFFSLPYDTEAMVKVEDFFLANQGKGEYEMGFEGITGGKYKEYEYRDIPLKFKTSLDLNLPAPEILLKELALKLAGVSVRADGAIKIDKKGIDISNADFMFGIDDIFTLLQYLPSELMEMITLPEGLSGFLPLNLSVKLMSPYFIDIKKIKNLSPEDIPAFTGEIKMEDANLHFKPHKGRPLEADDVRLDLSFEYDPLAPENTKVEMKELRMEGEGLTLFSELDIDNIMGEEQSFSGKVKFQSQLMETLWYLLPPSAMKIIGHLGGEMDFSGTAINLGKEGLKDISIIGNLESRSVQLKNSSAGNTRIKKLKSNWKAKIPAYPLNDYNGALVDFSLMADSMAYGSGGMNLLVADMKMSLDAMDTVSGAPDALGKLLIDAKSMAFTAPGQKFNAKGIRLQGEGNMLTGGNSSNYTTVNPVSGEDNSILASKIKHTPLVVAYTGNGGMLQTVMSLLNLKADLDVNSGEFTTASYLYPIDFSGLQLHTNLNDLDLSVSNVQLSNTGFTLNTKISGLNPFLTSYSATMLKGEADIEFSNVDINRLSWGYYGTLVAQGKDSVFYVAPATPYTAADSVCVVIPKNIDAVIRLKSKSAEYMQYRFAPLSTDIIVKDGDATLKDLTIGAPYCKAVVDWTYSTRNLDDIFMDLKAKVINFKFLPFYAVFPQLLEKAPDLKNLSGDLNADVSCRFRMFPDMFMEAESLAGRFDLTGSEMEFKRAGKIEKITHLMLIEGDEPIHIENFHITGAYHDNLLQLNPFKISFSDYQLGFAGINNTVGDMYYHIALEKSPFHLPFGVSLMGNFKHPEVKLGGTHIDDYRSEMVTSHPESKIDVNIMTWLHRGWLLFVQEAAKYQKEQEDEQ